MNKMRTIEIAVGLFMLLAIASLLMLALQVGGLSDLVRHSGQYTIKAEFENIGGLKKRAKVSVAGVNIGRVINVQLDPETYRATIVMAIDSENIRIPEGVEARILTAGLLGDNYISLDTRFGGETYLQDGDMIELASTHSALVLEDLISKFLVNKAGDV